MLGNLVLFNVLLDLCMHIRFIIRVGARLRFEVIVDA